MPGLTERLALFIDVNGAHAASEMKTVGDASTTHLGKAEKQSKSLGQQFGAMGAGMVAATAAIGAGLFTATKEFERVGVETIKLQRYMGESAEEASRFRFAAQQSGVDVEAFTRSLGKASKTLADSKNPMKDFGFATRDASGEIRPMQDLLLDVADKLEALPPGAERTAFAMKVFGKSGADVIPFLSKGRDGIEELMRKTDEYGLVLSGANLQAIKNNKAAHRELDAAVDGLQVKIGSSVLPVMTQFTHLLSSIPGPVTDVVAPLAIAVGGFVALGAAWSKIRDVAGPVNDALKGSATGLRAITSGAAGAAGVLALVVTGYELWSKRMQEADEHAASLGEAVTKSVGDTTSWDELINKQAAFQAQSESMRKDVSQSKAPWDEDWRQEMNKGADEVEKGSAALSDLRRRTEEYAAANGVSNEQALRAVVAIDKKAAAARDAAEADEEAKAGMSEAEAAQYDLNKAVEESEKAYTEAAKARDKFWNPEFDLGEAERAAIQAHQDLADAMAKNGTTLDLSTEAGRNNRQMFEDVGKAALEYGEKVIQSGGSAQDAANEVNGHVESLRQQMIQAGVSRTVVDQYITTLKLTPHDVNTQFHIGGITDAANSVQDLINKLRTAGSLGNGMNLAGLGGTIGGGIGNRVGGGRASGGSAMPGSVHPISERGTEVVETAGGAKVLVMGAEGGSVTPVSGGGASVIEHTTVLMLDGEVLARSMDRYNASHN